METEDVPDFRSRRAMFQQMTNSSNTPQSTRSHQGSGFKVQQVVTVGESYQKCLENRRATLSKESNNTGNPVLCTKPFALPRVKFNNVLKREEPKVGVLHTCEVVPPLVKSQNHDQTHTVTKHQETDSKDPESPMDKRQFRHTLLIWENASFQDTPPTAFPRDTTTLRTTASKDGRRSNGVFQHSTKMNLEKSDRGNCVVYQNEQARSKPLHTPFSENQRESPEKNIDRTEVDLEIESSEYGDERKTITGERETYLPTIKPLPHIEHLGPPPRKPTRPPVVDLSHFLGLTPADDYEAAEDLCTTPEITESSEELETYEDVLNIRDGLNSTDMYPATENNEGGYVYLTKEGEDFTVTHKSLPNETTDDLYYDVQVIDCGLNQMESSTFTSDSFSENSGDVYDDVHNTNKADSSSTKSDRDIKLKGIGRIFKRNKEKFILKPSKPKENGICKSTSVPNLKAEDAELDTDAVYNDVDNGMKRNVPKRVDDKPKKTFAKVPVKQRRKRKEEKLGMA